MITSAHSNKIIGLREKQTFHYWSTWKQWKVRRGGQMPSEGCKTTLDPLMRKSHILILPSSFFLELFVCLSLCRYASCWCSAFRGMKCSVPRRNCFEEQITFQGSVCTFINTAIDLLSPQAPWARPSVLTAVGDTWGWREEPRKAAFMSHYGTLCAPQRQPGPVHIALPLVLFKPSGDLHSQARRVKTLAFHELGSFVGFMSCLSI